MEKKQTWVVFECVNRHLRTRACRIEDATHKCGVTRGLTLPLRTPTRRAILSHQQGHPLSTHYCCTKLLTWEERCIKVRRRQRRAVGMYLRWPMTPRTKDGERSIASKTRV